MNNIVRKPRKPSNLLELLGIKSKYLIKLDESSSSIPEEEVEKNRIWLEYIPAHEGMIYLSCASPIELAYYTNSIGKINNIKEEVGNSVKIIKMDGEGIIYFNLDMFKIISKLARARRR
jgi:hypothetical protein